MTTFPNISLSATPRSIDVLVVVTPYPDGRLQDKQAVVNEGQYLGYIPIASKSRRRSNYPAIRSIIGGSWEVRYPLEDDEEGRLRSVRKRGKSLQLVADSGLESATE